MRRIFALIALGFILNTPLPAHAADSYRTYVNARFGFQVSYPDSLLRAKPESDNGDGRRFESPDRQVLLRAFASYNVDEASLAERMRAAAADWRADGARVTYSRLESGWYVLSGLVGGDIFYEKTLRGDGVFATAIWEYPRALRRRLDAPVTRTVQSFGFVSNARRSQASSPRRARSNPARLPVTRTPPNPPRRSRMPGY